MIVSPWLISALSHMRSSSSCVISGASSGSTHGLRLIESLEELFCFFSMAIPHRDDVAIRRTFRPHHDDHSLVQPTDRDPANLAVVEAIVDERHFTAGKYPLCVGREIEPASLQGDETFDRVESDRHHIKCTYIIAIVKSPPDTSSDMYFERI